MALRLCLSCDAILAGPPADARLGYPDMWAGFCSGCGGAEPSPDACLDDLAARRAAITRAYEGAGVEISKFEDAQ